MSRGQILHNLISRTHLWPTFAPGHHTAQASGVAGVKLASLATSERFRRDDVRRTTVWIGSGLIATAIACSPKEPDYEKAANTALSQAAISTVSAEYDDGARVLHVTGTVPTEADRQRAADIVMQAVDTRTQVANEVIVAGAHEEIADDLDGGLETRLDDLVDADPALKDQPVAFDAVNGVITITGTVATRQQRDKVGGLARNQPGVREVVNALELKASGK